METLYWISVIGKIHIVTIILTCVGAIVTFLFIVKACGDSDVYGEVQQTTKLVLKASIPSTLVLLIAMCFVPSRQTLYEIYGFGHAINLWLDTKLPNDNSNKKDKTE